MSERHRNGWRSPTPAFLDELHSLLERLTSRPEAIRTALARAEVEGFELHD